MLEKEEKTENKEKLEKDIERINKMNKKVEKVTEVMQNNINESLKRGEDFDELKDQASQLEKQSFSFHKKAESVRRKLWIQNAMYTVVIVLIIVVFLLLLLHNLEII